MKGIIMITTVEITVPLIYRIMKITTKITIIIMEAARKLPATTGVTAIRTTITMITTLMIKEIQLIMKTQIVTIEIITVVRIVILIHIHRIDKIGSNKKNNLLKSQLLNLLIHNKLKLKLTKLRIRQQIPNQTESLTQYLLGWDYLFLGLAELA